MRFWHWNHDVTPSTSSKVLCTHRRGAKTMTTSCSGRSSAEATEHAGLAAGISCHAQETCGQNLSMTCLRHAIWGRGGLPLALTAAEATLVTCTGRHLAILRGRTDLCSVSKICASGRATRLFMGLLGDTLGGRVARNEAPVMDLLDKDGDSIRFLIDPQGRLREPPGWKEEGASSGRFASARYVNGKLELEHVEWLQLASCT